MKTPIINKELVEVPVIVVGTVIYPLWHEDVECSKDYLELVKYSLKGSPKSYSIQPAILNVSTKVITLGKIIESKQEAEFNIGDEVLVEVDYNSYKLSTISDIQYKTDNSDRYIKRVSEIDAYDMEEVEEKLGCVSINDIIIYSSLKPIYIMEDGTKILWSHQIKKLVINEEIQNS